MTGDQLQQIVLAAGGASGLTAFLSYVVKVLWTAHVKSDDDVRAQRDVALKGWQDQTAATERLTDVLEKQARSRSKP